MIAVTAGETLTAIVGALGSGGSAAADGVAGGDSSLKRGSDTLVLAKGGAKGVAGGVGVGTGGAGGASSGGTGDTKTSGAAGASGSGATGGAGGAAATGAAATNLGGAGGANLFPGSPGGVGYVTIMWIASAQVAAAAPGGSPAVIVPGTTNPATVVKVVRDQAPALTNGAPTRTLSGYWQPASSPTSPLIYLYTYAGLTGPAGTSLSLTEQVKAVLTITAQGVTKYVVLVEYVRTDTSAVWYGWSYAILPSGIFYDSVHGYYADIGVVDPGTPNFGNQFAGADIGQTASVGIGSPGGTGGGVSVPLAVPLSGNP